MRSSLVGVHGVYAYSKLCARYKSRRSNHRHVSIVHAESHLWCDRVRWSESNNDTSHSAIDFPCFVFLVIMKTVKQRVVVRLEIEDKADGGRHGWEEA
jgi:hypothetical protein